jgi:hypothetical protein
LPPNSANRKSSKPSSQAKTSNGSTIVHLAGEGGHANIIPVGHTQGAPVDEPNDANQNISLHYAVKCRHAEIANFLVEHGVALDTKGGDVNMAKLLTEKSADVNSKDENDETPLHYSGTGRRGGAGQCAVERRERRTARPLKFPNFSLPQARA